MEKEKIKISIKLVSFYVVRYRVSLHWEQNGFSFQVLVVFDKYLLLIKEIFRRKWSNSIISNHFWENVFFYFEKFLRKCSLEIFENRIFDKMSYARFIKNILRKCFWEIFEKLSFEKIGFIKNSKSYSQKVGFLKFW